MDSTYFIVNVILSMRKFQKENNIKEQCITNVQYLYDAIKINSSSDVKVKAVIVLSGDKDTAIIVSGHLVVIIDDDAMIDPSYDVFSLDNKSYYDNITDLMENFNGKNKDKNDFKKIISNHLRFTKIAEQINNGDCLIIDKIFYNQQADYVEQNCS